MALKFTERLKNIEIPKVSVQSLLNCMSKLYQGYNDLNEKLSGESASSSN